MGLSPLSLPTSHPDTNAHPLPWSLCFKDTHTLVCNVAWPPSSCSSKLFLCVWLYRKAGHKSITMCCVSGARCSNYTIMVSEKSQLWPCMLCVHTHTHTHTHTNTHQTNKHTHQLQRTYHQQRASSIALPHLGGLRTRLGAAEAPGEGRVPGQIQTAWSSQLTPFPAELTCPRQPLPPLTLAWPLGSQRVTHLGRWVFCVGKYQSRVDEERGRGGGGRSTSHRPAAVRPPPTNESPRPHLSERGHTKTQRETESCHNEPRAADRNEHHMIPNHTGGGGRPRSVTTANVWATSNLLRTQSSPLWLTVF